MSYQITSEFVTKKGRDACIASALVSLKIHSNIYFFAAMLTLALICKVAITGTSLSVFFGVGFCLIYLFNFDRLTAVFALSPLKI